MLRIGTYLIIRLGGTISLIFLLINLGLSMGLSWAGTDQDSCSGIKPAPMIGRKMPSLIISGSQSVLSPHTSIISVIRGELSLSDFLHGNAKPIRTTIELHPLGLAQDVTVTIEGLGNVSMVASELTNLKELKKGYNILKFGDIGSPLQIMLTTEPLILPDSGSLLKGKLSVYVRGIRKLEQHINIQQRALSKFWTAFTWFFGVAIPAGLTALIGWIVTSKMHSITQRESRIAAHNEFLKDNQAELDDLFKHYRDLVCQEDDSQFLRDFKDDLKYRNIFEKLSAEESLKLRQVMSQGNREAFIEELVRVFPPWEDEIRNPEEN